MEVIDQTSKWVKLRFKKSNTGTKTKKIVKI